MSARIRKTAGNSAAARDAAAARPFHYCGRALCCDGVSLEELATEYGTPLYVYSAEQIRYRFGLFQAAFAGCGATVCYAVKANSSLAILRMLAELGAGFDIVSGGELERVRRASGQKSKAAVQPGECTNMMHSP